MKELRRLLLHAVLLFAAAGFAWVQSRPQDEVQPPKPGEVELWPQKPDKLERVELITDRMTVSLQRQSDEEGDFYRGQVTPSDSPPPAPSASADPKNPHAKPHSDKPVEAATFVSVDVAEKLAKKLAPFRAKRLVGQVEPDREEAFGLDEPEGTLVVEIAGTRHELVLGGATPGASDRYARYKADNLVYVIDASVVRDLKGGAARLSERQQHAFKSSDVESVSILAGDSREDLIRSGTEGRRFWAEPETPDVNAETPANWMSKVDRLRPLGFVEKLPEGTTRVARVEYKRKGESLGFAEIHLHPGDKDEYFLQTEYLRMPATIPSSLGEQVRDDLAGVFGTAAPADASAEEKPPEAPEPAPSAAPPASSPPPAPEAPPAPSAP